MSKFLQFHFQKIFSVAFQIVFRFFSLLNNKFFQFEDFQLQIFQAFIFFNFVFTKIFFRLNFVKFKCEFSSDFWRIKIQNFKRNFFRQLHTTEKVFAKGGLNLTESSISTNRSRCFFRLSKLRKKTIWKAAACKYYKSFYYTFTPAFCQYNVLVAQLKYTNKFV